MVKGRVCCYPPRPSATKAWRSCVPIRWRNRSNSTAKALPLCIIGECVQMPQSAQSFLIEELLQNRVTPERYIELHPFGSSGCAKSTGVWGMKTTWIRSASVFGFDFPESLELKSEIQKRILPKGRFQSMPGEGRVELDVLRSGSL
jgi:hypothetical protein